jgi:hypothetical protein
MSERNKTRKIRKYVEPVVAPVRVEHDPPFWNKFMAEGDKIHTYMTAHYDTMIRDDHIPHFIIRRGGYNICDEQEKIKETYGADIERELIPWIRKEHASGRLLNKELWRPFRDWVWHVEMYWGYKHMFRYGRYYFQLSAEDGCEEGCMECQDDDVDCVHFTLALYGWLEDGSDKLQPDNRYVVGDDLVLPDGYWKNK